jgi:hypothetical protein
MSGVILCVECARQKQPPRPAVWESRVGDICETCRAALKIAIDECDSLVTAAFEKSKAADEKRFEVFRKELSAPVKPIHANDHCGRSENCTKPAGHKGACPGGTRRSKVWTAEDAQMLRETTGAKTGIPELEGRLTALSMTVPIYVTDEQLNRFWGRLSLRNTR